MNHFHSGSVSDVTIKRVGVRANNIFLGGILTPILELQERIDIWYEESISVDSDIGFGKELSQNPF